MPLQFQDWKNHLNPQDKDKALKALDIAIEKGCAAGYQDLTRRLEAAGKKEKAEIFYEKDRTLKLKPSGSNS